MEELYIKVETAITVAESMIEGQSFEEAADLLQDILPEVVAASGEMSPRNVPLYITYGKALFLQTKSLGDDALSKMITEEIICPNQSEGSFSDRLKAAIQTATSAPVKSLDQALKEEADSNGSSESSHTEKNGEEEKDKKDEGEGEEEEEEGEDDGEKEEERDNSEEGEKEDIHNADERADIIELAWQWLDLSRLILTQTANLSNWEQLKEVHTLLAQISLESNNAAEALEDLNKALAIATENSKTPSYDRGVCETLFLTALAYALAGKYDDGISTLIEASSVLSRRIEKKTEQEEILKVDRSAISLDDQITDSISELKNLLIEITTKIEEFTKIALPIDDSDASSSSSQTTVSVFPSSSSQTTVSVSSSSSSSAPPSDGTSSKVRDFGLVGSRIGAKRERQDSPTEEPSKQAKSE